MIFGDVVRHASALFQRVKVPPRSGLLGPGSYPDAGSAERQPVKHQEKHGGLSPSASTQAVTKVKTIEAPKFMIRLPTLPRQGEGQGLRLYRLPGRKQGQQPERENRRSRGRGMSARKGT